MTARKCPGCGKMSLRVVNVMSTTETIHWHCNECCYKEVTDYNYVKIDPKKKNKRGADQTCLKA